MFAYRKGAKMFISNLDAAPSILWRLFEIAKMIII